MIGDITYSERNFMGTGQFVQVKLSGSQVSYGVDTSWTEPRFLDRNLSLGVDLFVRNSDYKAGYRLYCRRLRGLQDRRQPPLRFRRFSTIVWLNTNYTFIYEDIYNLDYDRTARRVRGCGIVQSSPRSATR